MTRIITGTATVALNSKNVTAWVGTDGALLSSLTAPVGSQIVIDGYANFIEARPSSTTITLLLPHRGASGTLKAVGISAVTEDETNISTLNARTAQVLQELSSLDSNSAGFFYNLVGVTGSSDPGPGNLALNNSNPQLVTAAYLDNLDANNGGRSITGLLELLEAGSILVIRSIASTAYYAYQVNAPLSDDSGFYTANLSYIDHDGILSAEPVSVAWSLSGKDKDSDVTVNTLTDRAAHDGAAAGWRVMVANTGDGRAARYVKISNTSGDWSAPAYFTGPIGPIVTIGAGTTSTLSPGVPATAALAPVSGGYLINFGIPQGVVGPKGDQGEVGNGLQIDALGTLAARSTYNAQPSGFAYFDIDSGNLYFRNGVTSGVWAGPFPLRGPDGTNGALITTTSGVGNGTAGPYTLNATPYNANSLWASISGVMQYDYTTSGATITFGQVVPTGVAWRVQTSGPLPVAFASALDIDTVNAAQINLADIVAIRTKLVALAKPTTAVTNNIAMFNASREVVDSGGARATQAQAEAGTNTTAFMTPQRTAQAIAALAPTPNDLYSSVSALALSLADLQGSRLGMSGGIADAFDDETGIKLPTIAGNDSFTKILLHFDGVPNSTVMTDSAAGGSAHTWTAVGDAKLSTTSPKFGATCLLVDSVGDYIITPNSSDFLLGSSAFTIDLWFDFAGAAGTTYYLAGHSNAALSAMSWFISHTVANKMSFGLTADGSTAVVVTGTTNITAPGLHHLEIVRTGNILKLFMDGVQEGGDVAFSGAVYNSTSSLAVGCIGEYTGNPWPGYIDEFRLSVGVARHTANFTPPALPYDVAVTTGSTNQVYNATLDLYSPVVSSETSVSGATGTNIGNMTSAGGLASAFDGNTSQTQVASALRNSGGTGYIGKTYSGGRKISKVMIYATSDGSFNGTANANDVTHTLYGKQGVAPASETDGTVLGTFTAANSTATRTITSSDINTTWDHVWIRQVNVTNTECNISEVIFYTPGAVSDMMLISVPTTATAVPTSGRISVQIDTAISVTPNTDLIVSLSRDGGTTYTVGVLALVSTIGNIKTYEASGINLATQPSGSSVVWKVQTVAKNIPVSGVVAQWK